MWTKTKKKKKKEKKEKKKEEETGKSVNNSRASWQTNTLRWGEKRRMERPINIQAMLTNYNRTREA